MASRNFSIAQWRKDVAKEIRDNVGDSKWLDAESLGAVADIFARTFAMAGNHLFPLYFTLIIAHDWIETWKLPFFIFGQGIYFILTF